MHQRTFATLLIVGLVTMTMTPGAAAQREICAPDVETLDLFAAETCIDPDSEAGAMDLVCETLAGLGDVTTASSAETCIDPGPVRPDPDELVDFACTTINGLAGVTPTSSAETCVDPNPGAWVDLVCASLGYPFDVCGGDVPDCYDVEAFLADNSIQFPDSPCAGPGPVQPGGLVDLICSTLDEMPIDGELLGEIFEEEEDQENPDTCDGNVEPGALIDYACATLQGLVGGVTMASAQTCLDPGPVPPVCSLVDYGVPGLCGTPPLCPSNGGSRSDSEVPEDAGDIEACGKSPCNDVKNVAAALLSNACAPGLADVWAIPGFQGGCEGVISETEFEGAIGHAEAEVANIELSLSLAKVQYTKLFFKVTCGVEATPTASGENGFLRTVWLTQAGLRTASCEYTGLPGNTKCTTGPGSAGIAATTPMVGSVENGDFPDGVLACWIGPAIGAVGHGYQGITGIGSVLSGDDLCSTFGIKWGSPDGALSALADLLNSVS